ncbi:hypothetical protein AQUCO_01400185v1 [Aquilegia coerulea]|uniref:WAT1-related protein n=1 Tax=Aquilegia coerulea TaxID=218851 RepID=A0A2G5DUZ7_AQUCA|nr:hypothetical protein AQUCO_01400185v1 [Aquilegia coerulea]
MEGQGTRRVLVAAFFNKVKPFLAMVFLQVGFAGMFIVTMLCLKRGLSHYVLVVYRHAAATIAVAPFAFIFERKIRPKMTLKTFLKIMALGLIEPVIDQNLYYLGLQYTSATFASAMFNILPAITFIMAIIFRLERVSLKSIHSQAKIVGTIVTLGGAMIMTLYKGPILEMFSGKTPTHSGTTSSSSGTGQNLLVGTLMLLGSCTGWSGFFILQSVTLKEYPAELSLTSLIVFLGMVQGGAVALVMEHDFKAWAIGFDSRLLAPVYSGIVCSAMAYYLQGVVMKDRGPVFVTAFNPLCMIIVAALGSLILAEQLHLGSVIGAVVIVIGLYSVIWGKSQDHIESPTLAKGKGSSLELPVAVKDVMDHENAIGGPANKSEIPTTILVSQK